MKRNISNSYYSILERRDDNRWSMEGDTRRNTFSTAFEWDDQCYPSAESNPYVFYAINRQTHCAALFLIGDRADYYTVPDTIAANEFVNPPLRVANNDQFTITHVFVRCGNFNINLGKQVQDVFVDGFPIEGDSRFNITGCFTVDRENAFLETDGNGSLYSKDKKRLIYYHADNNSNGVTIPEGVETIEDSALVSCRDAQEMIIPSNIREFDLEAAFAGGVNMIKITFNGALSKLILPNDYKDYRNPPHFIINNDIDAVQIHYINGTSITDDDKNDKLYFKYAAPKANATPIKDKSITLTLAGARPLGDTGYMFCPNLWKSNIVIRTEDIVAVTEIVLDCALEHKGTCIILRTAPDPDMCPVVFVYETMDDVLQRLRKVGWGK